MLTQQFQHLKELVAQSKINWAQIYGIHMTGQGHLPAHMFNRLDYATATRWIILAKEKC